MYNKPHILKIPSPPQTKSKIRLWKKHLTLKANIIIIMLAWFEFTQDLVVKKDKWLSVSLWVEKIYWHFCRLQICQESHRNNSKSNGNKRLLKSILGLEETNTLLINIPSECHQFHQFNWWQIFSNWLILCYEHTLFWRNFGPYGTRLPLVQWGATQRLDCTADGLLPSLRHKTASGTARSTLLVIKALLSQGTYIETSWTKDWVWLGT